MLPINDIIARRSEIIEGLKKKRIDHAEKLVAEVVQLNERRKSVQSELDQLLNSAKTRSKQIGLLMKEGKREEAEKIKSEVSDLKSKTKELQEDLKTTELQLRDALYNLPNAAHKDVPTGNSSEDNLLIHQDGTIPELGEDAEPHWELIKKFDLIDFDLGNKIAGAGFPVYKGKGAKLQRALVNFFLFEAEQAGYVEIQPPVIINTESGYGTGQLPDKEGQMYGIVDTELYLIPTAEVPITNIYRDVILNASDLPIKNAGYSLCFRREAGSWGAHVRGLNRLHQFDKVEIVQICKPEESYDTLEAMCLYVQGLLEKLEVPYRRLLLCGGDLGFTSAKTYDFEVYSAAQKKWLEVSSVSNFESYQANRLKLRYRDEHNKTRLLHTLNGSAIALPRLVAAILENNQHENGITVPEALRKYTGFDTIK